MWPGWNPMEICGMLIRDRVTKPLRISKRHLDRAVSALPVMLPELMLPFSIWTDIGIPPNWQMSWENDRKPCTNYGKMIQTDGTLFRMIQNKDGSESLRFGGSYFKTSLIGKQSTNQPFHLKKKKLHKALPKCHACSCFVRAMVAPPSGRRSWPAASVGQWNH